MVVEGGNVGQMGKSRVYLNGDHQSLNKGFFRYKGFVVKEIFIKLDPGLDDFFRKFYGLPRCFNL
mgnify:CR=1 FL=1